MRETAAQKRTRISMLLAEYDAANREANKAAARVKDLKAQIADIPNGTYGDWIRTSGTPRSQLDQKGAKDALTKAGIAIPMILTAAPIVVTPVTK